MKETLTHSAVVVGGSSGVGLAVSIGLMRQGYHVHILSRGEPEECLLGDARDYTCHYCDLFDFNRALFEDLSRDEKIDVLFISSGIGRVADFEYLHESEIKKIFTVNAMAAIEIIRIFYSRIKSNHRFYCGVMGSIAGWISSPMFSVYAASKAAICRFIESVNIELEVSGTENRILNVSTGFIKGTRFNGGENNLAEMGTLPDEIIGCLFASKTLYIPQYDNVYADVLARYQRDGHGFGLQSYTYKLNSGRVYNECKAVIGYLSGTFDLFHIGHLNLLRRAKRECDYLIVGVHESGAWKAKETFIPFEERMAIIGACKYVDQVVIAEREDCDAWPLYHFSRLFVGSDYKGTERFARYEAYFADKNVKIVYFPYTQGTSSTQLRDVILQGK